MRAFQLPGVATQELDYGSMVQASVALLAAGRADCRIFHLFHRCQHFLGAIGEPVNLAGFSGAALPLFEGRVDASQDCLQRNAGVLPGLHQGPIQRGQQQQSAATALEMLLDFREVVEVGFHYGIF